MQLQTLLIAALSATSAMAAPAPVPAPAAEVAAAAAATPQWTMTNMKRTCNAADTSCTWSFGIDATASYPKIADRMPVACTHVVKGANASKNPASAESKCGFFTVTSGWNAGGWTTLSVKDVPKGLAVYPAYEETAVAGGKVVKPNRAFDVNKF